MPCFKAAHRGWRPEQWARIEARPALKAVEAAYLELRARRLPPGWLELPLEYEACERAVAPAAQRLLSRGAAGKVAPVPAERADMSEAQRAYLRLIRRLAERVAVAGAVG